MRSASVARIVEVEPGSPADHAGLARGDVIVSIDGVVPRDVIEWSLMVAEPNFELEVDRGGLTQTLVVDKAAEASLGAEVESALFDEVRTCDNHCEFCFIYQLPPGLRPSLYVKDDDYRLSFLYGNFTTLTRFTESDLERVITERLSPLYVSIHGWSAQVRTQMLRNPRGATSLRWLGALVDAGIEVHGQIVVCPGQNEGAALHDTFASILERVPGIASVACVPLGISKYSKEPGLKFHTAEIASQVIDTVEVWQPMFQRALGHPMVFAADEYYLLAHREVPSADAYGSFSQHENGIGIARAFEREFAGTSDEILGVRSGFFKWVDGAQGEGYRAPRSTPRSMGCGTVVADPSAPGEVRVALAPSRNAPTTVLTGAYGAALLRPLLDEHGFDHVEVCEVPNEYFGGNISVAGLMAGQDVARVLNDSPTGRRYLLPDVCLSNDRFIDGMHVNELPQQVEVVTTDGRSLRQALQSQVRSVA